MTPYVAQVGAFYKLHQDVLGPRRVTWRRRVSVHIRYRQPKGAEKVYSGNFTRNSKVHGDRDRVRDARHHLEAMAHGDEEGPVKATLGQLFEPYDIGRISVSGLRCESFQPIDIEDPSALLVAKVIVEAEYVRGLVTNAHHRMACVMLTSTGLTCIQKGRH